MLEKGDDSQEIKKRIGKLTRWERRRIKGGDKTLLYTRLGIAEESDIDVLKKKFGVKNVHDESNIDEMIDEKTNIGRKRSRRKVA